MPVTDTDGVAVRAASTIVRALSVICAEPPPGIGVLVDRE